MSAEHPGPLRRFALRVYKGLPPRTSQWIVRRAAPAFTVGAVAMIEHEGQLLALRQTHRRGLSLPGGLVDAGEVPQEAVVREVEEETGLRITSGDVWAVAFDAQLRHCDVIFRVHCDRRPTVRPASEATAYRWVDLDSLAVGDGSTQRIVRAWAAASRAQRAGELLAD